MNPSINMGTLAKLNKFWFSYPRSGKFCIYYIPVQICIGLVTSEYRNYLLYWGNVISLLFAVMISYTDKYPRVITPILSILAGLVCPVFLINASSLTVLILINEVIVFSIIFYSCNNDGVSSMLLFSLSSLISHIWGWLYFWNNIDQFQNTQLANFYAQEGAFWQHGIGLVAMIIVFSLLASDKSKKHKEQEKYKEELNKLNVKLENSNKELQETNSKLELALSHKENFILRFSHEIRNPLNCILGNLELCTGTVSDPETHEMLHEAKVCGEILLQLLNNILDTAKVTTGRLETWMKSHNIREFLENTWIVTSEIIKKKNLQGAIHLSSRIPLNVEFDNYRLMQIIINLVSNASKFTKQGHVMIYVDFEDGSEIKDHMMKPRHFSIDNFDSLVNTCNRMDFEEWYDDSYDTLTLKKKKFRTKRYQKLLKLPVTKKTFGSTSPAADDKHDSPATYKPFTDGYLRFEIVDTGCGIKQEDMKNLFTKFKQVNEEAAMRQIGTGLGLWITKEIIELMQGRIQAYSSPGVGTSFVLMLKSRFNHNSENLFNSLDSPCAEPLQDRTALVVDDVKYNREINMKFLAKSGVQHIQTAEDGLQALNLYKQKGPNYFSVILMDIDMPIMDGMEATKKIREFERLMDWNPVNILIITAYSERKIKGELLDPQGPFRANAFLPKPVSYDGLVKTLRDFELDERPLAI